MKWFVGFVVWACCSVTSGQMMCPGGVCTMPPNQPVRQVVRVVTQPVRRVVQQQPVRMLMLPRTQTQLVSVPQLSPDCTCENCMCGVASVMESNQPNYMYVTQTAAPMPVFYSMEGQQVVRQEVSRGPVRGFFARKPLRSFFRRLFRL